jgi:hypothetical protein
LKPPIKKRPPNAFLLFCREERPKVCARCPGMTPSDVSSLLSHLWRSLSNESKMRYKREEHRLQAEFNSRNEDPIPPPRSDPEMQPRSTTLDLPHLSAAMITGNAPVVLPSLESVQQQRPPPPAPAKARRFDTTQNTKDIP